jgi:uncharacterized protein DUF6596
MPFVVRVEAVIGPPEFEETDMTHYLLSVHGPAEMGEFGNYGSREEMEAAFAATGAFNDKLKADGYWVFAGGLQPASTATVVKIPYRVPERADLPGRLSTVLTVLFLVFNEGYLSTGDGDPVRAELTAEAIRLARVLHALPEVTGLLALLLLTEARREARVRGGELVPLTEQDRGGWDHTLIVEGHDLVRTCLAINRPGRYQLLAAINAVHR